MIKVIKELINTKIINPMSTYSLKRIQNSPTKGFGMNIQLYKCNLDNAYLVSNDIKEN